MRWICLTGDVEGHLKEVQQTWQQAMGPPCKLTPKSGAKKANPNHTPKDMTTSVANGEDGTLRVEPVLPLEPYLTGSDSLPDPLEGPRIPAGITVASGGELSTTSYLEAPTRFLTAPLDASQGVTVRRRRNAEMHRDSLPWGTSSAPWATAPLAGNLSGSDRPADRADASEAAAWRTLQASEEAWNLEREEYRRTMQQMQLRGGAFASRHAATATSCDAAALYLRLALYLHLVLYLPTELGHSLRNLLCLRLGCLFNHNHLFNYLFNHHHHQPLNCLCRPELRFWLNQCQG
uniref:Uncharacterized protein n=1 Tax=Sphaerodactylus townsendi TaxID=933632 RepID=A0ACB8F130_9SAUR